MPTAKLVMTLGSPVCVNSKGKNITSNAPFAKQAPIAFLPILNTIFLV